MFIYWTQMVTQLVEIHASFYNKLNLTPLQGRSMPLEGQSMNEWVHIVKYFALNRERYPGSEVEITTLITQDIFYTKEQFTFLR